MKVHYSMLLEYHVREQKQFLQHKHVADYHLKCSGNSVHLEWHRRQSSRALVYLTTVMFHRDLLAHNIRNLNSNEISLYLILMYGFIVHLLQMDSKQEGVKKNEGSMSYTASVFLMLTF